MIKKIILTLILGTSAQHLVNAQKIKSETLEFTKIIQPKLLKTVSPIDITLVRATTSDELKANELYRTNVNIPQDITNNTSTPQYIAILDYIYSLPKTKIEKLGPTNILNAKSNTTAVLYLMEKGKGLFYTEKLVLNNTSDNTYKTDYNEFTTVLSKRVPDAEISGYLQNGQIKPELLAEIEKIQIERLTWLAYKVIRTSMTETSSKNKLSFNYIKKDDDFNATDYNNAFNLLKENIDPLNKSEILKSIKIWKDENAKISDVSDKNSKKYKISLLENILSAEYLIDDFTDDSLVDELKSLDPKNDIYFFYSKQKNNYAGGSALITDFTYTALPTSIEIPADRTSLFTTNNTSGKSSDSKINKLGYYPEAFYAPLLQLNNFKYELSVLKDNPTLSQNVKNEVMDQILWYIMKSKDNIKPLKGNAKKILEPFSSFSDKLNAEFESNKLFKFGDSRIYKVQKAREYVAEKYKMEDFYKYISDIESATIMSLESKHVNLNKAQKNAVDVNSIVQLKKLVGKSYYEDERRTKEIALDAYVESKASFPTFKNEVYFEFKNSEKVLNSGKELSEEEYFNYEYLINVLIFKLNSYR